MKALYLVLSSVFLLGSCMPMEKVRLYPMSQNRSDRIYVFSQRNGFIECPQHQSPKLPRTPKTPVIPDSVINDRGKVEDILVESLRQHREHIAKLQDIIEKDFENYRARCFQ